MGNWLDFSGGISLKKEIREESLLAAVKSRGTLCRSPLQLSSRALQTSPPVTEGDMENSDRHSDGVSL
jgi:hypothetical protein